MLTQVNDIIQNRENHKKYVAFLQQQIDAKESKKSLRKLKDNQVILLKCLPLSHASVGMQFSFQPGMQYILEPS